MFLNLEKMSGENVAQLGDLNTELHLLEVETFEIEDLVDLGQNPAALPIKSCSTSSCSSSCCSCTSSSGSK